MMRAVLLSMLFVSASAFEMFDESISEEENNEVLSDIAGNSPYHLVGQSGDGDQFDGKATFTTLEAQGDDDREVLVEEWTTEEDGLAIFTLGRRTDDSDGFVIVGAYENENGNFGVETCDTLVLDDGSYVPHHCSFLTHSSDGTTHFGQEHYASSTETDYDDSLNSHMLIEDNQLLTDTSISVEENNRIMSEIAGHTYQSSGVGPSGPYTGSITLEVSTPEGSDDGRQVLAGSYTSETSDTTGEQVYTLARMGDDEYGLLGAYKDGNTIGPNACKVEEHDDDDDGKHIAECAWVDLEDGGNAAFFGHSDWSIVGEDDSTDTTDV